MSDLHVNLCVCFLVCHRNGSSFQCKCEDQYIWSYENCISYTMCGDMTDDTCECINNIPSNRQFCHLKKDSNAVVTTVVHTTSTPMTETALPVVNEYLISVELNMSDVTEVYQLRTILRNISYPLSINEQIQISDVNISTVCSASSNGIQCRCEDGHRWSCDQCLLYGSCDNITDNTCGCINAIPPDGRYCKSIDLHSFTWCPNATSSPSPTNSTPSASTHLNTTVLTMSPTINGSSPTATTPLTTTTQTVSPTITRNDMFINSTAVVTTVVHTTSTPMTETALPVLNEYLISVELNMSDVTEVYQLRTILRNISYPLSINEQIQISDVNISTVCSASSNGIQCRCEDGHRWSCDQCLLYGSCDNITDNTCGCINAIPPDGRYCKSIDLHNKATCSLPVVNEYLISVELNMSDVTEVYQLRTILRNISYPLSINEQIQISDVNISTVCSASSNGIQCRCEDGHRWSCDQCLLYGSCDNITDNTCGCINAIPPDGRYCKSVDLHSFTWCPNATSSPSPTNSTPSASTHLNTTVLTMSPTINAGLSPTATTPLTTTTQTVSPTTTRNDSTAVVTTVVHTTSTPMTETALPVVNEYLISVELNMSDVTEVYQLRTILRNISYPLSINEQIQISDVNISTVCSASSNGIQCRCEDGHRWSCDQCLLYGSCDNITDNTCGCINAIPPDGRYCKSIDLHNSTAVVQTTSTPMTETGSSPIATTPTVSPMTTSNGQIVFFCILLTGFDVEMSFILNKTFTAELNNATSFAYKDLESRINSVLQEQYKGITGFVSVFVRGFSKGSIITSFVVKTTQVILNEIAEANDKLPEAMQIIAPTIGPVVAFYNSPTPISRPELTYTGNSMTLTCGPPPTNINVGHISVAKWKFNGQEIKNSGRIKITTLSTMSLLTVNNVILLDIGLYECTLRGEEMDFHQKGLLTGDEIKPAPVLRLQSKVNIKCKDGLIQSLRCCVQSSFRINWFHATTVLSSDPSVNWETYCIVHHYKLGRCSETQLKEIQFMCKVDEPKGYQLTTTMTIFREDVKCDNAQYGTGRGGDISTIECGPGQEGRRSAVCQETGEWQLNEDSCIIPPIKELLIVSQDLGLEEVPQFLANLSDAVQGAKTETANSSATISAIIKIISIIANVSIAVSESGMKKILETVDVIISDDSRESWAFLNANQTGNASSELLGSLETLSNGLVGEFDIVTEQILLNRTTFNNSFGADLNSWILLEIPHTGINNVLITTITFPTLNNVIPARNSSFEATRFNATNNDSVVAYAINAAVVLVKINETIQNFSLSFDKRNKSLSLNPQCVFWNFTLFHNFGAWDDDGCTFVSDINNTVTCSCNHLTSFSILMATDIPPELTEALDIITYVGVGISLASLGICLIIEGYVWKAITRNNTSFMRHVSIINTAISLMIADICFIVGASFANSTLENPGKDYEVPFGPCSTVTFFTHLFYLALFFWMLVSGLLLFYRTVMVFSHMSKSTMLAISFSLGYGCPLIIAVTTVAVTGPGHGYIRRYNACWLNWMETKALLALVVPALTIVFINILVVIVVLFKMLRRGVGDTAQTEEKHTLMIIARCIVILTPLFGLTWSLGVGTVVSSTNKGIQIAFAFFNSLQGFFILVFGTLFDSKIRSILLKLWTSPTGSDQTRSTGISYLSGLNWINQLHGRRRNIYRVSEAINSSSGGSTETFIKF
ncbi:adhesion G protein-coupled receptor F5-like [Labrus mixtus]|uniref:adhesion G protein-coupled receptor F5-like n=1 Tax=Labrus mixtus TaxID=508554 RepID=UPI0029C03C3F|nr:adhesion G protein-coupled receptor F5-like [Labrus mixtus]